MTAPLLARVLAHPRAAPALIVDGAVALTYGQLADRAARLGASLIASGCGRDSVVGIGLPRSAEYVIAMLGIWHAGAAFLPLPPSLPEQRRRLVAADAGACLIIDDLSAIPRASGKGSGAGRPGGVAYVIYTSGSTGLPKGVRVGHGGLAAVLEAQVAAFAITAASRCLWLLSPGFDASISDVGTALWAGAALHVESGDLLREPARLQRRLLERRITHVDLPPALLPHLDPDAVPALETVVIGGEVAPRDAVRRWAARTRLINVYGPTEATICASLGRCQPDWDRPLIGAPIAGAAFRIAGEDGAAASEGELWIGGPILALGYTDPALTAARFARRDGQRWYRTGDRVRRHPDDTLEFLGRLDRQLKIAGQLIAPEEIEERLRRHPDVERAAVVPRAIADRSTLEAWITTRRPIEPAALRTHLAATLPAWMVPSRIHVRDRLPLTAAGKPDLIALAALGEDLPDAGCAAAAGEGPAALLLALASAVIGRPIACDDDLFAAGCDSLGAIELVVRAEACGLPLTCALIHRHRTVQSLAAALDGRPDARDAGELRAAARAEAARIGPAAPGTPPDRPRIILVTGATGFLGRHLIRELLARTDARLHCLVRAPDEAAAAARLTASTGCRDRRLHAVAGDLERERLGLPASTWDRLATEVDTIHHLGAAVNLALPYEALAACNVGGTREVLRLLGDRRRKRLHLASTLSVLVASDRNRGVLREDDDLSLTGQVFGGYAQSKWVAETLVRLRADLGAISCYRFGLLTGDTATATAPPGDWLARCVRALAALGRIPEGIATLAFDVTPVDYAAAAMAALSLEPVPAALATFHIANHTPATGAVLTEALRRAGSAVTEVGDDEWQRIAGDGDAATALGLCRIGDRYDRARPFDLFQATGAHFDQRNTEAGLAGTGLRCPAPSPALLERYVRRILETGP